MSKITVDAPKALHNPQAAFIRELEIMKHKLEIKPRKVNMMQSQIGILEDFCADVEVKRKMYIPNSKGGFI